MPQCSECPYRAGYSHGYDPIEWEYREGKWICKTCFEKKAKAEAEAKAEAKAKAEAEAKAKAEAEAKLVDENREMKMEIERLAFELSKCQEVNQQASLEDFLAELRLQEHLSYFESLSIIDPEELQYCSTSEWEEIKTQLERPAAFRRLRAKLGLSRELACCTDNESNKTDIFEGSELDGPS